MTCRDFADFVIDYFEGELDAQTRVLFDQHLAACADCAAYLSHYRETTRAAFSAYAGDTPPDMPEDLVRSILAVRTARTA